MTRKIKYKTVSKELESLVKPSSNPTARVSVGLDDVVGEFFYLSVHELKPFKNQARSLFSEKEIEELALSIKEHGIRQPLTVKRNDKHYEVVSGERRLRAAKIAKLEKVPCIILKENADANAIALIENIHRSDLHPIELGMMYNNLIEEKVFETQEALSKQVSVPKSTISEYIQYSSLPEEIRNLAILNNINSREKLRSLLKAHNDLDMKRMKILVGEERTEKKSFSILRMLYTEGKIKTQSLGIKKLSAEEKQLLKQCLLKIIEEIDVETVRGRE